MKPQIFVRLVALVVLSTLIVAVPQLSPLASLTPASATGESWSPISVAEAGWFSVATDGNGVWVAVAEAGDKRVMRSTDDGATWTAVAATGTTDHKWRSVAYGNGVWVALSSHGASDRGMRSTDNGETWSALGAGQGVENYTWRSVATDGNGVWVAGAVSGQVMRSEDDGATWTAVTSGVPTLPSGSWRSLATDGNGIWVAISTGQARILRSEDDGVNWSVVAVAEAKLWSSVAYGNVVWVAVAVSGEVMRSENNGVNWSAVAVAEANKWQTVAYGNGVWVAVSTDGDNRVMRSEDDGVNWSAVAAAEANSWRSVAYGNGVWVAVSTDGDNRVMRSLDPVSPDSSTPSTAESAGLPGIFLYISAIPGRSVEGTPVLHGSAGIASNTSYTLSVQSMGARALTRTVLATGLTNGRGHAEGRIELGALAPGSYKIVMTGTHRLGHSLVLTNHISVDAAGKFVSVSAESQQPFLN